MSRNILLAIPLFWAFEASALTFKSGQSLSGDDSVAITPEIIDACASDAFKQGARDYSGPDQTWQAMSFNIRYDNPSDGKNNWQYRIPKVTAMFEKHDIDFGGLQEVLHHQLGHLEEALPDYEFVGVGRDDGKTEGEYAPLFFRKNDFTLLKSDTIWLSETPEKIGSRGWDAALPRITSFATLRHNETDTIILLGSAHYDHRGKGARRNSGAVIHDYISKEMAAQPSDKPIDMIVLAGDFNDIPNSPTTKAIENKNCLFDARRLTENKSGPNSTWNGFRSVVAYERLDYIFTTPATPILSHVIDDSKIDGRFPSDHLPVIIQLGKPQ